MTAARSEREGRPQRREREGSLLAGPEWARVVCTDSTMLNTPARTVGRWWSMYLIYAAVALSAVWLHRYPAGIDLPQHGNIFQILANYRDPTTGYAFFYTLDFYTPYALLYAVAWPLTAWGGALFATKVVLSIIALCTPIALWRWLKEVHGEPDLAVLGFPLVFGFAYQWGFLSFLLSTPVALFFLAENARFAQRRSWGALARAALMGLLLFFTHGATFTIVMAATGIACLAQRERKKIPFELLQFAPAALALIPWYVRHKQHATGGWADPPNGLRLISLFSGPYHANPNVIAAGIGFAFVASLIWAGKPRVSRRPSRVLPFLISLLGLLLVPEWVGGTWLVGTRFVHLVYAFVPAAVDVTEPKRVRTFVTVAFWASMAFLASIHVRLSVMNRELDGLDRIARHIPADSDVQLFAEERFSRAFDTGQLGQVVAWLPAARGGFIENDQGRFWNIPVQRRPQVPWPQHFEYRVTRGTRASAQKTVGSDYRLIAVEGAFHVFRREPVRPHLSGLDFIRVGHFKGASMRVLPAHGARDPVGGVPTAQRVSESDGIEIGSPSVLQLRPVARARQGRPMPWRLQGRARLAEAKPGETARFVVSDAFRQPLWSSAVVSSCSAEVAMDIPIDRPGDVFLSIESTHGNPRARWSGLMAVGTANRGADQ